MLSVLIPTWHYNTVPLVTVLHRQCLKAGVPFEIRVIDDGSGGFLKEQEALNQLSHCSFESLPTNIGRSRIRNLLAKRASYNHLLFLDADVMPVTGNFIREYVKWIDDQEKVVSGGLRYRDEKPSAAFLLRWTYGHQREAVPADVRREKPHQRLLASNFMITRKLIEEVPFEENIADLRREDTLFSYQLMQRHALVVHIENPVYHDGLDPFEVAIAKEHQSLEGLHQMLQDQQLPATYTKISSLYQLLCDFRLRKPVAAMFRMIRHRLLVNLSGARPSMRLFDLYRIGYLCSLKG